MDIIHNNIHMDMVKCRAVSQMTLEDDMNLPQDNPDLDKIIFREGTLNLTDTVVTNDHVLVKGQLLVTVLYLFRGRERKGWPVTTGKLSFEENVYLEGIQQNDTVDVTWKIEDLSGQYDQFPQDQCQKHDHTDTSVGFSFMMRKRRLT